VLLVRQILESRTPRNLVSHTTPELLDFLRNGSGLRNPEPLERALSLAEMVRFRSELPTEAEWERFREKVSDWLRDEDPDVGRKRRIADDA
jgi:hypothetical protein